jgi:predicted RNA-binding protein with PIN domain
MNYLIDGHNLIGQLPDIDLTDPNDEALLVQKLNGWTARTRHHVVVIFDNGLPGGPSRLSTARVRVIFAPPDTTADSVMRKRIFGLNPPDDWVVVTDDHAIQNAARARRMGVLRSTEFAGVMLAPPPAPAKPTPDIDPDVRVSEREIAAWMAEFAPDVPKRKKRS